MNQQKTKVATRDDILKYLQNCAQNRKSRVVAMYNSQLDMLIEGNDQDLMVFPIDDRLANRAHGAMETGNVKNYRISSLDFHMNRLFRSAEIIGLKIDLTKEQIKDKIHEMAFLAYKILERENHPNIQEQILVLKIWVSTGIGDFDIYGCNKESIVYAALYINGNVNDDSDKGVKEYIHLDMWTQPNYFSNAKTVNYLELATMADYSKVRGGYFGIKVDPQGNLLEGAISNVAFLTKDNTFGYPPLNKTIRGNTLNKALKIVDSDLLPKNVVKEVKEIELNIKNIDDIVELFHLSNDHIIPILSVNDQNIGNGEIGPITKYLQEKLEIARSSVKLDTSGDLIRGFEGQQ
ncbi:unnamed protein product [Paramecium sonneborni]|uniref:Uncharacterized protein n=1 Tax=Paramecium sonneborni TaxID=65129 RepID=A0A8S1R2D7_9CILI|nr:unnamed protein product [Paramecium sonneborni]